MKTWADGTRTARLGCTKCKAEFDATPEYVDLFEESSKPLKCRACNWSPWTRYYQEAPSQKSIEQCEDHGRDHRAYGWSKQIDPRWAVEQTEAYLKGYAA